MDRALLANLLDRPWSPDVLLEGADRGLSCCSVYAFSFLDYLRQDGSLAIDTGKILVAQLTPMGPDDGVHLIPAMFNLRPIHGMTPNCITGCLQRPALITRPEFSVEVNQV
jgi:hypothetical protein